MVAPPGARERVRQPPMVTSEAITAAAAGTCKLGGLTVNRLGFGAMRLTGGATFDPGARSDRDRSITAD